ncbi:unnamed protein product, partial [marine sediment metagenome]
ALKDENYLDYIGLIFKDPEAGVDDKKNFDVSVPEEVVEATIVIGEDLETDVDGCPVVDEIVCEEPISCPTQTCEVKECVEKTCPSCEVCSDVTCPTPEDSGDAGAIIIAIIGIALGGGAGVYFTRNQTLGLRGGLKLYNKSDGTVGVYHKHPGIRSYHDPSVSHRDEKERHPKGQLHPHYVKNESGVWVYDK